MIEWDRYVEEYVNASFIMFSEYKFDTVRQEFDRLDEEFDRIFDNDLNEVERSESYMEFRSRTIKEEVDVLLTEPLCGTGLGIKLLQLLYIFTFVLINILQREYCPFYAIDNATALTPS